MEGREEVGEVGGYAEDCEVGRGGGGAVARSGGGDYAEAFLVGEGIEVGCFHAGHGKAVEVDDCGWRGVVGGCRWAVCEVGDLAAIGESDGGNFWGGQAWGGVLRHGESCGFWREDD